MTLYMKLFSLTTLWITLLALASLLMSGIVSGYSVMDTVTSAQMQQGHTATCTAPTLMAKTQHHTTMPVPRMQQQSDKHRCDSSHDTVLSCCDTTCSYSLTLISTPVLQAPQLMTQTRFHPPLDGSVIQRTHSLYRPPNA